MSIRASITPISPKKQSAMKKPVIISIMSPYAQYESGLQPEQSLDNESLIAYSLP